MPNKEKSTSEKKEPSFLELAEEYYRAKEKEYLPAIAKDVGSVERGQRECKMPVLPTGEMAQRMQEASKERAQSDKESADSKKGEGSGKESEQKASVEHHKANPGPVVAENLGEPASKEELKARAAELNK